MSGCFVMEQFQKISKCSVKELRGEVLEDQEEFTADSGGVGEGNS